MKLDLPVQMMQDCAAAAGHAFIQTMDAKYLAHQSYWLNEITLSKFHKEPPELKILLVIDEGNLQGVFSTQKINLTVIDHDNMREGDRDLQENNWPPYVVEPGVIEQKLIDALKEYEAQDAKDKTD